LHLYNETLKAVDDVAFIKPVTQERERPDGCIISNRSFMRVPAHLCVYVTWHPVQTVFPTADLPILHGSALSVYRRLPLGYKILPQV